MSNHNDEGIHPVAGAWVRLGAEPEAKTSKAGNKYIQFVFYTMRTEKDGKGGYQNSPDERQARIYAIYSTTGSSDKSLNNILASKFKAGEIVMVSGTQRISGNTKGQAAYNIQMYVSDIGRSAVLTPVFTAKQVDEMVSARSNDVPLPSEPSEAAFPDPDEAPDFGAETESPF